MPNYDYKCQKCGWTCTVNRGWRESIQHYVCPQCNDVMEKQISAPAVHFKGSGFYETDYKGK